MFQGIRYMDCLFEPSSSPSACPYAIFITPKSKIQSPNPSVSPSVVYLNPQSEIRNLQLKLPHSAFRNPQSKHLIPLLFSLFYEFNHTFVRLKTKRPTRYTIGQFIEEFHGKLHPGGIPVGWKRAFEKLQH